MLRRIPFLAGLTLAGSLALPLATATAAAAAPTQAWSVTQGGWDRGSSPVIADIDGNGINDVVVGHQDGWVRVFKDGTGSYMPGWPQPAIISGNSPTAIESSPTVADLDRDGTPNIIMGTGSTFVQNQPGGIVVFNSNGSVRCRWAGIDNMRVWGMGTSADGYPEGVYSTPAVGDVDGDGYMDIVFGGWDAHIHVLNRNCQETVPRYFNDDTIWSSPALFDVDGDGRMEIFIGGDSHAGPSEYWEGGQIRALDWRNGQLVQFWRQRINEVVHSSLSIGDIDGDGRLEVVHGAGDFFLGKYGSRSDSSKIFAWHVEDGSAVPGWPQATGGVTWSSPVLADVNGDGVQDVVTGSRDHKVWAWRGNGARLWAVDPAQKTGEASTEIQASPIVSDITGDGRAEVVIGTGWGMFVLDGPTGARVGAPIYGGWSHEASAAVGNFGPNGWRIVTAGFDTPHNQTRYAAWSIPAPGKDPQWPMWRKNSRRLGTNPSDGPILPAGICRKPSNPPGAASSLSGKGYWVLGRDGAVYALDAPFYGSLPGIGVRTTAKNLVATKSGNGYYILATDGGVFSFGDARFFGSMGGKPLNGPIIGMTPTADGGGYWLLGSDGGIFSFGNARFWGSMGGSKLNAPVISMNPAQTGGYWLLGGDGGVFTFGPGYYGSIPGTGLCDPPAGVALRASNTGKGYWILSGDGGVWSFGDAMFHGSVPGAPVVDLAIRR